MEATIKPSSSDRLKTKHALSIFNKAIPSGSIIEAIARVQNVGRTSLKVKVEIFLEHMYNEGRELAIEGVFTFVALDENKQPIPVLEGLDIE